jgi:hypothetical protein
MFYSLTILVQYSYLRLPLAVGCGEISPGTGDVSVSVVKDAVCQRKEANG